MPGIAEEELLEFLKAIEEGKVSLQPEECIPQDIYAGNVPYRASNGWRITIFNDCNEWDYIDKVIAVDGRLLDFEEIDDFMSIAREYVPDAEVAWSRYGIPGYMRFRCTHCGADTDARGTCKGGVPVQPLQRFIAVPARRISVPSGGRATRTLRPQSGTGREALIPGNLLLKILTACSGQSHENFLPKSVLEALVKFTKTA